jgi:urease accessory protein
MNALLLLLLDSRAPAGAHHHSSAMEAAVGTGLVTGLADVEGFCQTRLRTSARVAAAFAATSARLQTQLAERSDLRAPAPLPSPAWAELDAEYDARTPSEAARAASRQLGRGLIRLARSVLPEAEPVTPWTGPAAPHHPLVLGSAVTLAGGTPRLAARAAALAACAGPASAAVRLLGLDPFAAYGLLARLAPEIDACADAAAQTPELPADGAPALDLLADYHLTTEVRLFAS